MRVAASTRRRGPASHDGPRPVEPAAATGENPGRKTILVTGFEAFGGHPDNPSASIAHQLDGETFSGVTIVGGVLPVVYRAIDEVLPDMFDEFRPSAMVMLGLAASSDSVRFERIALNLDDANGPDNEGVVRVGKVIDPTGPAAYWSTLPLDDMAAALEIHAVPVSFSRDAGGYLCNHVFYRARRCIDLTRREIPAGFIHLPWPADWPTATRLSHRFEFDMLFSAVQRLVAIVAKRLNADTPT